MDLEPHCKSCAKEIRKKYYPSQYAANKRYQAKARKTLNAKRKERYHQNINFKLSMNLGNRIRKVLEGISKSKRTIELLGCSQAKCFHYTNLQPLWMADNISKGDNVPTSPDRMDLDHSAL